MLMERRLLTFDIYICKSREGLLVSTEVEKANPSIYRAEAAAVVDLVAVTFCNGDARPITI